MNDGCTLDEKFGELDWAGEEARLCRNRYRQKRRAAAPCPRSAPWLNVYLIQHRAHMLRFHHQDTPQDSVRPYGAASLQLYVVREDEPATSPDKAIHVGDFKRNPVRVEHGAADDRKVATYFSRWVHQSGETGPWSLPVSMRIAA